MADSKDMALMKPEDAPAVRRPSLRFETLQRMAGAVAGSGLFGIKTQEQAVALMLVAQAEGRHPASVAQDYNIIQGRPALKADAMLARFQQAGGVVAWEEMTDQRVAGMFSHPRGCPKPVLIDWTMERARQAGIGGKDNWTKYPRQMLRARVISEGVRATYPAVCAGVYTPEEVADFTPDNRAGGAGGDSTSGENSPPAAPPAPRTHADGNAGNEGGGSPRVPPVGRTPAQPAPVCPNSAGEHICSDCGRIF